MERACKRFHALARTVSVACGGGGFGGGGLPYPGEVLQLWGGEIRQMGIEVSGAPAVRKDDGSGVHRYAIIAVGVQGKRT